MYIMIYDNFILYTMVYHKTHFIKFKTNNDNGIVIHLINKNSIIICATRCETELVSSSG